MQGILGSSILGYNADDCRDYDTRCVHTNCTVWGGICDKLAISHKFGRKRRYYTHHRALYLVTRDENRFDWLRYSNQKNRRPKRDVGKCQGRDNVETHPHRNVVDGKKNEKTNPIT